MRLQLQEDDRNYGVRPQYEDGHQDVVRRTSLQLQNRKGAPKLQINKDTVILTVEVPK